MTFFGILLILLGIAVFVGGILISKEPREVRDDYGNKVTKNPPQITKFLNAKVYGVLIGVGVLLNILSTSTLYARAGHQYFVVTPFGGKYAIMDSGFKFLIPFSTVQEWEKFIDVKVIGKNGDGNFLSSTEGVDGVISDRVIFTATVNGEEVERSYYGISITFIDKVRGVVSLSSRFELPADEPSFLKLAEEFRHPLNLVNNTLIPTVKEQVVNTAYMFSADDYVSGDASNFRQTLDDQLKNGGFAVDKLEQIDTIYAPAPLSVEGNIVNKTREIQEIKTFYKVTKRLDVNGKPIRIPHDITKNKVQVSQVIVEDVELEPKFRQKLEMQRDISAQKGIELQMIETAAAATKRITAEGERDKTAERMKQEEEQVKKLIAIETMVKEEESKRQLAVIALETSRLDAQKRKVDAEAKKYELQQADGLSEAEKYVIDAQTKVGLANAAALEKAFQNLNTVIQSNGDTKNGNSLLESLIGAELAKDMIKKPTK